MKTDADMLGQLKVFDAGALASAVAWGQNPQPDDPIPTDSASPRLRTRAERRRLIELQKGQAAADRIGTLPGSSEVIHLRMDGSFDGYDFVPAILDMIAPATIAELHVATLSFNKRVADRLLAEIDAGRIGRVVFLSSSMFAGKEVWVNDHLAAELATRGGKLVVARNHCKLLLAATTDGRRLVMEGSQNMRRCHCAEQATLADDAALYAWHRDYIESAAS